MESLKSSRYRGSFYAIQEEEQANEKGEISIHWSLARFSLSILMKPSSQFSIAESEAENMMFFPSQENVNVEEK